MNPEKMNPGSVMDVMRSIDQVDHKFLANKFQANMTQREKDAVALSAKLSSGMVDIMAQHTTKELSAHDEVLCILQAAGLLTLMSFSPEDQAKPKEVVKMAIHMGQEFSRIILAIRSQTSDVADCLDDMKKGAKQ